jgi:predicted glycoside hydrolase/deacetylase ChbG (UPF0249 family)
MHPLSFTPAQMAKADELAGDLTLATPRTHESLLTDCARTLRAYVQAMDDNATQSVREKLWSEHVAARKNFAKMVGRQPNHGNGVWF